MGNEVGQPPSHEKLDQAWAFSNKIILLWFSYGHLWKRVHLYRQSLQRLSDNALSLSGKVILCTSKFIAVISKQTIEAARKVWNADEFHRHTQVTMHRNLKAIGNQEVVPWIFKSITVKWIQLLFFFCIFVNSWIKLIKEKIINSMRFTKYFSLNIFCLEESLFKSCNMQDIHVLKSN